MKAVVTGAAGVLGSSLCELLVKRGYRVVAVDIVRVEEAWRLRDVIDRVEYVWKSEVDITADDIRGASVVFDCAIGFPDRPFGTSSPRHTLIGNLLPPLSLLEATRYLGEKPVLIYPSSFNAVYGYKHITEGCMPNPTSLYGATKGCAELLYLAYHRAYSIPVVVTRVGSAFGPKGRSDELPHKLIIYALKNRGFYLKSPRAKRLWCYSRDVLRFYEKLLDFIEKEPRIVVGRILHCAGNKGDRVVTNLELAEIVKKLTGSTMKIIEGEYEPGELVNGEPVSFTFDSSYTRKLLNWEPAYTLEEGLRETIEWFKKNLHYYA